MLLAQVAEDRKAIAFVRLQAHGDLGRGVAGHDARVGGNSRALYGNLHKLKITLKAGGELLWASCGAAKLLQQLGVGRRTFVG